MISLVFTPRAERDLEAIGDYIAKDSHRRALSFVRELRAQCVKITNAPHGYRIRPELGEEIRSCAHGRYLIYFVIADEAIYSSDYPYSAQSHGYYGAVMSNTSGSRDF